MKNIAIFASGNGTNAENIARYFLGNKDIRVSIVLSNSANAGVHQRASRLGIPSFTFRREDFAAGTPIVDFLKSYDIDLIVLAGFLCLVSKPLLDAYPEKIINIHPALLPKFGGKGMYGGRVHEAVIAAGEKESGITIHYIDENYDKGSTIFQATCPVMPGDSPDSLAARVHALEYEYFPKVIEEILSKES